MLYLSESFQAVRHLLLLPWPSMGLAVQFQPCLLHHTRPSCFLYCRLQFFLVPSDFLFRPPGFLDHGRWNFNCQWLFFFWFFLEFVNLFTCQFWRWNESLSGHNCDKFAFGSSETAFHGATLPASCRRPPSGSENRLVASSRCGTSELQILWAQEHQNYWLLVFPLWCWLFTSCSTKLCHRRFSQRNQFACTPGTWDYSIWSCSVFNLLTWNFARTMLNVWPPKEICNDHRWFWSCSSHLSRPSMSWPFLQSDHSPFRTQE